MEYNKAGFLIVITQTGCYIYHHATVDTIWKYGENQHKDWPDWTPKLFHQVGDI